VTPTRLWKICGWTGLVVALAAGGFLSVSIPRNRLRAEARRLVFDTSPYRLGRQEVENKLLRLHELGGAAYPFLGEMLLAPESSGSRIYFETIRPRLPRYILKRLGEAHTPFDAQRDAAIAVEKLGPVAARALNRELCQALPFASRSAAVSILDCLLWSAPDSNRTLQTISNYLASADPSPPDRKDAAERMSDLAARMPEWAPMIARRPGFRGLLTVMGTNSLQFIPELISVAVTGQTNDGNYHVSAVSGPWQKIREDSQKPRCEAIETLGKIARGNAMATSNLLGLINDPSGSVVTSTVLALSRSGACPKGALLSELQTRRFHNYYNTAKTIEDLAEIGPAAGETLPWLKRFASIPDGDSMSFQEKLANFEIARPMVGYLPLRAVMAACRVAPEQAGRFASGMVFLIAENVDASALMRELKPCGRPLLESLAASLPDKAPDPVSAAVVILCHEPKHDKALETLRDLAAVGSPGQALDAAYWLWKFTGDPNPFLSRARKGIAGNDQTVRLKSIRRSAEMKTLACPLGPALRAALEHPDAETRDAAGMALMKIAPNLMPPIGE
jgi:hypothetical protein